MIERVSLERQIAILGECGIPLPEGLSVHELVEEWGAAPFEDDPFRRLVLSIGGEVRGAPSTHLWHFDTECIEDHGAYVHIAERMRDLARGDLPLTNIRDFVDVEEGVAWLAFELDGKAIRWDAEVDDDWADPMIFTRFAELLALRGTGARFTYLNLGGQDCVIGCATEHGLATLNARTGLEFTWLS
jgi:hypothetical protein